MPDLVEPNLLEKAGASSSYTIGHNMIGHDNLRPVRNPKYAAPERPALFKDFHLLDEILNAERDAITYNIRDMAVKYPRRKLMQSEFAIIIDNGMASVAAALKTDYHI